MNKTRLCFGLLAAAACLWAAAGEDARILRPSEGSYFASGPVDVVATAPGGKLELDGRLVTAERPFPDVLHAVLKVTPGEHVLALAWNGGRRQVRFFAGPNPPRGFQPFHQHPPLAGVPCTECHELSRTGRFRFKGGCFDCHQQEGFTKLHTHNADVLSECGLCHNAHGSTVKAHLLYPRQIACKQCHD